LAATNLYSMYPIRYSILAVLGFSIASLAGCNKVKDAPTDFSIAVEFTNGGQPLVLGQDYTNTTGQKYSFTLARLYFSGFQVSGGHTSSYGNSAMSVHPEQDKYLVGMLTPGNYNKLRFLVGLDSVANHSDPTTFPISSPLNPASGDAYNHWSWADGYIFIKLEGMADTTTAMTGPAATQFVYHVGLDELLREKDFSINLNVQSEVSTVVVVRIDLGSVADALDFKTELRTHTLNNLPLATKVADLVAASISVVP
jgi:hypothetical protein